MLLFFFFTFFIWSCYKYNRTCKDKTIIQPCLHDEGYAYMNLIRKNFLDSKRILFNSLGECEISKKYIWTQYNFKIYNYWWWN